MRVCAWDLSEEEAEVDEEGEDGHGAHGDAEAHQAAVAPVQHHKRRLERHQHQRVPAPRPRAYPPSELPRSSATDAASSPTSASVYRRVPRARARPGPRAKKSGAAHSPSTA